VLYSWRLGEIRKIHSYVQRRSYVFGRALTFCNGPWETLSSSDMVITCGNAVGQAHYQNSMVLVVVAICYSSNTPVHGYIQLINLRVIHQ
jgi:hypothetical protein